MSALVSLRKESISEFVSIFEFCDVACFGFGEVFEPIAGFSAEVLLKDAIFSPQVI